MKFEEDFYPVEFLVQNPDGSITGFVNERHCRKCGRWYSNEVEECPYCVFFSHNGVIY